MPSDKNKYEAWLLSKWGLPYFNKGCSNFYYQNGLIFKK